MKYYNKSANLVQGYAIIYDGTEVSEYIIDGSGNNIITTFTKQTNQNIVYNVSDSGSNVTITIRRDLITTNPTNDFEFDLTSYTECYPILLTAMIGDQLTFSNTNSFASSYVYIYKESFRTDS